MEPYDIFWFEEPIGADDYRGHGKLADATSIPIATGENEYTRYGFRDLIANDAAAIYNADAQVLSGITEFMNVAALAAAHDLHTAPHGDQEIHLHLVGRFPTDSSSSITARRWMSIAGISLKKSWHWTKMAI